MNKYAKRLAAIAFPVDEHTDFGDIDAEVRLIALALSDKEPSINCAACTAYATALVDLTYAEMKGMTAPTPIQPPCWGSH